MKSQIFFGVIVAVLLVGARSEDDEDWTAEEEACVNELKLNKETIQALDNQDVAPEDNSDFNNFLDCSWKKKNLQDAEGVIDFDSLHSEFITIFHKKAGKNVGVEMIILGDIIKRGIDNCKKDNIKGDSHGQTIAKLENCIIGKAAKSLEDISSEER